MSLKEKLALNLMIWLCVYPSVLLFSYAFEWLGFGLPLWLQIGISTAISVPLISTFGIPQVEKALASAEGLTPADLKRRQAEAAERSDP